MGAKGRFAAKLKMPSDRELVITRVFDAPRGLVFEAGYEAMPGRDYLATVTLAEQDGKTTLRSHLLYQSVEDRDGHLQSGMEPGVNETFDRLNELLQTMA